MFRRYLAWRVRFAWGMMTGFLGLTAAVMAFNALLVAAYGVWTPSLWLLSLLFAAATWGMVRFRPRRLITDPDQTCPLCGALCSPRIKQCRRCGYDFPCETSAPSSA
jgi:hypothetical protein